MKKKISRLLEPTQILLGCGLSIAALFATPLIPPAVSQESSNGTPLKDICQEGWSRYTCGTGVRLCVSPDVEKQYDLKNSIREVSQESCHSDSDSVPEAWTHATPEEMGYLAQDNGTYRGYNFRAGVVSIDSSRIRNGDLKNFILSHKGSTDDYVSYDKGFKEHISRYEMSVDSYNIKPPSPKTPVTDVCPAQWSRFSCQFVRLCASPSVVSKYDLASSDEFKYAHCKADGRSVPETDTHFSPYDVGYGALLVDRVYFKAVKIDSSDIFEGDIEEAIERLVLIPIQPHALMNYDRGYEVGRLRFERSVSKANQKQKESEGSQSPH